MKEFIEKLIERLNELANHYEKGCENRVKKGLCRKVDDCGECAFIQSIEIVQELEKEYKGGWIPCSERSPEKQGSYLIQDNHNNIKVAQYDYNTQHTYRAWWIDYTKVNVLAWCELPAPYKEGE